MGCSITEIDGEDNSFGLIREDDTWLGNTVEEINLEGLEEKSVQLGRLVILDLFTC